jgi:putative ABC transport system permease protein
MLTLALKQVLAQRFRLALTSVAVVLGVTFLSGTMVLTDTSQQLFDDKFATQTSTTDVTVRTAVAFDSAMGVEVERDPVPADLVDRVIATEGVDRAAGLVSGKGLLIHAGEPVQGSGPSLLMSWAATPFGGFTLVRGGVPERPGEVVVDRATARSADLGIGDLVTVQADRVSRLRVVGLAKPSTAGAFADSTIALVETGTARRLLRLGDGYSEIRVIASEGITTTDLARQLAESLGGRYSVTSSTSIAEASAAAARGQLSFLRLALLALAGAALLIGAYLIANTFSIVIAQRTGELALLRAGGATPRQVFRLLLGEALLVGGIGSGVGTALGIATAHGLRGLLDGFGVTLPNGAIVLRPSSLLIAFGTGLLVTTVAALGPSRRAARISPLQAMRASQAVTATSRVRIVVGAVAAIATVSNVIPVLLGVAGVGAVASAAATGVIALSALGPVLAGPLTRLVGRPLRRLGVSPGLAREFAARSPRRTAATVMALSLSLALIAFMTVLAASVKDSIAAGYRETISADYVIESSGGEMLGGLSPAVYTALSDLPQVEVASPMRLGHWRHGNITTALTAIEPGTIDGVASFKLREGALNDLDGGGVVVSEKVAERDGLGIGDTLAMTFPRDGRQPVPVVGVFEDSVTQAVQTDYLVSLQTYDRHFTEDVDATIFLDLRTGVHKQQTRHAIEAALADFPTAAIRDQDAAVDSRTAVVDEILGLVTVLLTFTVLIALLGITNTLALSILERTREIGLLRAVGMSDRQLRWMVRSEAVLLAALAVVLGLVLGLGFGAIAVRALADGQPMPVVVPFGRLLVVVAVAVAAGLAAGLLPARRATRLPVLEAINGA